jgi:hypothetical protein
VTRIVTRAEWGARDPISNPGPFREGWGKVLILHYTGVEAREDPMTDERKSAYLRELQAYYQSGKHPNGNPIGTFPNGQKRYVPYSDTGYNLGVFADGTVTEIRGLALRSGANGTAQSNAFEPSCLLVGLDVGELVTPEMIEGVRWLVSYLRAYTGQPTVVAGHRDRFTTTCPGDPAYELIAAGEFLPRTPPITPPPPPPPSTRPPLPNPNPAPKPIPTKDDHMLTYFRNAESRAVPTQPNPNTPDGLWFPGQVIYVFNANTGITRRARELEVAFNGGQTWADTLPAYSNGQIDNMIAANAVTV